MRLLTSRTPATWQELQTDVAAILTECGFSVEIEKTVKSVRGSVEIDVYGEEDINGRKHKIACECKHWQASVPQTVIHAFRTVVADIGTNVGYLISSGGFQSGSLTAAELTNLELLTWEQFQDAFCETWLQKFFLSTLTEKLEPLFVCTEPLPSGWLMHLPDPEVQVVKELRKKYDSFGWFALSLSSHGMHFERKFPELPLRDSTAKKFSELKAIPDEILDARGYRDLLEALLSFGQKVIDEFHVIRERNGL